MNNNLLAKTVLSLVLVSLLFSCSERGTKVFYMSPEGSDKNQGTIESPIASFAQALKLIRENSGKNVLIYLRGGQYILNETFTIHLSDWDARENSLVFEAYQDEIPVISSDIPVTNWKKTDGNIWEADIPAAIKKSNTLYMADNMLQRAKSKGFYLEKKEMYAKSEPDDKYLVHLPDNVLKNWNNLHDAEITIIPTWHWIMNRLPIGLVDKVKQVIRTSVPGTYALNGPNIGYWPEGTCWIENALEFLDEPGEWVMDSKKGKIYYWPLGQEPENIRVPGLTEYIRLEGDINYDGANDKPIKNISFIGITFTRGDRFDWEPAKTGWGLQHDWEMFDRPTAMVRMRGAENCILDNCRFFNSGGTAVRLDLHCQKNEIINSTIENVGGAGILLAGYGPGTKNANHNNKIINNEIHHTGKLIWHSAGIFAWQSGENIIQNNHIHNVPYIGIVVSGRIQWDRSGKSECSKTVRWTEIDSLIDPLEKRPDWYTREPFLHGRNNLIENNDINHTMEIMGDGNCIYISGTGKNNIVRYNYMHDNVSPSINANVRCDDDQHETIIENNIIANSCGEGFINKGKNTFKNNIIYNLMPETPGGIECLHQRGYNVMPSGDVSGSVYQNNIFYSKTKDQIIITARCKGEDCPVLENVDLNNNVYFNEADPNWAAAYLDKQKKSGREQNSVFADPNFTDASNGDFSLKPGSPALKLGFVLNDMSRVGLLEK